MNARWLVAAAAVVLCVGTSCLEAQDQTPAKPAAPAARQSGQQPAPPVVPPDYKTPKAPEPVVEGDGKVVLEKAVPEPAAGDALFAPLATAGPDTLHRKFMSYAVVTFGPRALFTPAIGAAIKMAHPNSNYPPEWQDGAGAFGRNYGNSIATKTAFQTARFSVGAVLHEDFRYRPADSKDGFVRTLYAIGFIFVDRSDSGHLRPALANFSAAAAGGFVGNAYLPDGFNDVDHGLSRMGTKFGSMAIQNVLREFAPEIYGFTSHHHIPFPRVPIPEWWVPRASERHRP